MSLFQQTALTEIPNNLVRRALIHCHRICCETDDETQWYFKELGVGCLHCVVYVLQMHRSLSNSNFCHIDCVYKVCSQT